jgi:hypothetical protein
MPPSSIVGKYITSEVKTSKLLKQETNGNNEIYKRPQQEDEKYKSDEGRYGDKQYKAEQVISWKTKEVPSWAQQVVSV